MVDDKFRGTKADLERWIDWVDDNLRHVPHGQTVRYGDGPERRLTMREMFTLERLDRLGPDAVVTVDLAPFEMYWRQTMLSCFPPEKRYDSDHVKRRLQKKGAHLIALPAVSVPVLCASGMHFKVKAAGGVDEYCVVEVSTLPVMYRRKEGARSEDPLSPGRPDHLLLRGFHRRVPFHSWPAWRRSAGPARHPPLLLCRCPQLACGNGRALRIPGLSRAGRLHSGFLGDQASRIAGSKKRAF